MERKGQNRKVALGCCGVMVVGAVGCVALSVFVLWRPIPLSMQGYVEQFDKTGTLDLTETDPIDIRITPMEVVRKDEQLNRNGKREGLLFVSTHENGPGPIQSWTSEFEGTLAGPGNNYDAKDWRCFRLKEHYDARSVAVTKSFSGRVTLIQGYSYWSVMFASGPLFCQRTFVNGKLVESQNYRMSD